MQVKIETQKIALPPNARGNLTTRVARTMSRVSDCVRRLQIQLKETNSKKGAKVKICTIKAQLVSGDEVIVVDKSSNAASALFGAIRRCRKLIPKKMHKRRNFRRTPQPEVFA